MGLATAVTLNYFLNVLFGAGYTAHWSGYIHLAAFVLV